MSTSTGKFALLAVPILALAALTGCGAEAPPVAVGASTATTTTTAAAAPSASAAAFDYQAPANACKQLDLTAMTAFAGASSGVESKVSPGSTSITRCQVEFSKFVLSVELSFYTRLDPSLMYDGLRGVRDKEGKTTTLADVGQGAYSYLDPQTGPMIDAYDGNLYVHVTTASKQFGQARPGAEVFDPMASVVKGTMAKLRQTA